MSFTEEKQGQDAPASPETQYRIVPAPDGLFGPGNDTFKGALNSKFDEDWILIRMLHPEEHTITLTGTPGGVVDPILKLYDLTGSIIAENDDIDVENGNLNSELTVSPRETSTYYISVSAFTGNPSQDNEGAYTITVKQSSVTVATDNSEILTGTEEKDVIFGLGGDDVIDGRDGNDKLDGGDGDDRLYGGELYDKLYGGYGDDWLYGDDGADTLEGGPGADTLIGGKNGFEGAGDIASYTSSTSGVIVASS